MTVVDPWLMWSPPGHPNPFLLSTLSVPASTGAGPVPLQVQDFALPFAEHQDVPVIPFLQPGPLWYISHSHQFCLNLLRPHSAPSPWSYWAELYTVSPLEYTASCWPPQWLCSTEIHLTDSSSSPWETDLWKSRLKKPPALPLSIKPVYFIEGHHVFQALLPFCESVFGFAYVLVFAALCAL